MLDDNVVFLFSGQHKKLKGFIHLGIKVKKEEFRDILSLGYLWNSSENHFRI